MHASILLTYGAHACLQFPYMNPFPGDHSVLVCDNCPIHVQLRVGERVHELGGIVIFLEPYDPDSMPVEFAYRLVKNWMRKNGRMLTENGVSLDGQLRMAARSIGRGHSRHAFHAAGYAC